MRDHYDENRGGRKETDKKDKGKKQIINDLKRKSMDERNK